MEKNHPKWGCPILIQNNAAPHTSALTIKFLDSMGVKYPKLPPYSPDLSPPDFWLFPKLKKLLSLKRYSNARSAGINIKNSLKKIEISNYREAFNIWIRRLKKCVKNNGEYIL